MREVAFAPLVATVCALAFAVAGCSESRPAGGSIEPVELAAAQKSMQSIEQTKEALVRGGWRDWRVVDQPTGKPAKERPNFEVVSAEVEGLDRGIEGVLKLDFLNGRLMATWFFPKDFNAYKAATAAHSTSPAVELTFGSDYQQRPYARWEDVRLRKEMDDWIKSYS